MPNIKFSLSVIIGLMLLQGACSSAPNRAKITKSGGQNPATNDPETGSGNGEPGANSIPTTLTCSPGAEIDPGPSPLRRLTRTQYINSVKDLLGDLPVLSTILTTQKDASAFGSIPSDVSTADVASYQTAANAIAIALIADKNKLKVVANCESATVKRDCAKTSIQAFATKAFRSPVAAADVDKILALYDIGAKVNHEHGIELAVATILQMPRFLYQPEIGTTEASGSNAIKLTGYEIATRLAFAVWDSTPDARLLKAAEAGELSTAEGVKAQLSWMLEDAKGKVLLTRFLEEWVRLEDFPKIAKNTELYPDWTNDKLRAAMPLQASAFFADVVNNQGAKLSALLTSPRVMVNQDIAPFYGVTGDATFKALEKTDGKASGLLTLPAILALTSTASESSPVYRGRFVRQSLLCQQLPHAPANIPAPPEVTSGVSTRERLKEHEVNPSCAGCHTMMDPIGFGFESFDAMGKYRATDGGSPVDDSGELTNAKGAEGKFNGVVELGKKLAASSEVQECVTRQWFRFMLARFEQEGDSCALRKAADGFIAAGTDMKLLPAAIIGSDAFLYRRPFKN